ncbi:SDR family oxidoreductase [Vibrio nigripulchritudo]|uniref:SDR family oxidoreductase n=1 Tax=Vibrio nigripulchritudo TaxID=28173 RepID=UPI0005F9CA4C|nr:SDR family oxidoreductase [Vibrio nigripulchritudo]KJY69128.1 oxidoreductase [Vibrio nigripulchritudo]
MTKSILITGCSTGIGYVCAHELNKKGYLVVASCRREEDVARLRSEGLNCVLLDVSDTNSITSGLKEALAITNGKLDALFNNGAYGQAGALEDLPTDALREQFETNVFGWHELVKQVLPLMRAQGYGRIIQNSSVLGFAAMKYRGAYNASKFALEGWTDTIRLELANSGIHISLIEPGPIETQFRANALKHFQKWINVESSVYRSEYELQLQRLGNEKSGNAFTLPPESIVSPLIHAIEANKPKIRYRVTTPTKVFAVFKRILPTTWLDKILSKAA